MARKKLVRSQYAVLQQWAPDRLGLFHSLRGSIMTTSPEVFRAVAEEKLRELKPESLESLQTHGFVVVAGDDEYANYQQAIVANEKSQPPTVEVTFLATGPEKDQGIRPAAVQAVSKYLDQMAGPAIPLLVKFRFCGHSIHPLQERLDAFDAIAKPNRAGLNIFKMWLTDTIQEVEEPLPNAAIALFFQWHLNGPHALPSSVSKTFKSIRRLAEGKRIVFIQVVADAPDEIKAAAKDLRAAAKICGDLMGTYICWGFGESHDASKVPYFVPPICEPIRTVEHVRQMRDVVEQLHKVGIPAPFPVFLRHQQGGCSYTHPLSVVLDREGKKHRCLLDGHSLPTGRRSKKQAEAGVAGSPKCSACSMLPVCEAVCPRHMQAGVNCEEHREILQLLTDPVWALPAKR